MTSTPVARATSPMVNEQATLSSWPTLSVEQQAFVAAYVENSYSHAAVAEETGIPVSLQRKMLMMATVKNAVKEVQDTLGEIDFLNENWVKTQLLRIFPMVMGDEAVPMIDSSGNQITARKFVPESAIRILEYVAPKKAPAVQININNKIDLRGAIEEAQTRRKSILESNITDVEVVENAAD